MRCSIPVGNPYILAVSVVILSVKPWLGRVVTVMQPNPSYSGVKVVHIVSISLNHLSTLVGVRHES